MAVPHLQPFPFAMFGRGRGYIGPGNVVSGWLGWWGLRAFSAAIAATGTQKAINVRRASDSSTTDILILTTGRLDIATLTAFQVVDATGTGAIVGTTLTFTGGHIGDVVTGGTTLAGTIITGGASPSWTVNKTQTVASATLTLTWGMFVTKFYDQSASTKDMSQATAAKQPQIILTGGPSGGVSVVFVASASQGLVTATNITTSNGSVVYCAERTGAFTSVGCVISSGGSNWSTGFFNVANKAFAFAGLSAQATANDSTWHAITNMFTGNGGTSGINVDGTFTQSSTSVNAQSGVMGIGENTGGANFLTGNFVEGGVTSTILSSAQQASINSNLHGTSGWNF